MKQFRRYKLPLVALIILVLTAGSVWFWAQRPDINLAVEVIRNASNFPRDDLRVELASSYLIWTEHEDSYDALVRYLWICAGNPEYEDYRAERVARILGSYQSEQSLETLVKVLDESVTPEGIPFCTKYVWEGLALKGERGYKVILDAATGTLTRMISFRRDAIRKLGQTKDPVYIEPLTKIVFEYGDPRELTRSANLASVRSVALWALSNIGTPEAIDVIRQVAEVDPFESVRERAKELLADISPWE